jgi:hypothetical protein
VPAVPDPHAPSRAVDINSAITTNRVFFIYSSPLARFERQIDL